MYIFHLISIGYKKKSNIFIVSNLDKKREKIYRKDMHFKKVIILKQHLHVTSKIKPILGIVFKMQEAKSSKLRIQSNAGTNRFLSFHYRCF